MSKIIDLLYILGTVVVIAIVLYMIRYYFSREGFADLLTYCKTYPESKAPECMATTLKCGFDKWKGTDKAEISVATIPTKTRQIIDPAALTSQTITLAALTDLVVQGCIKKFGKNEVLVKHCAMDSMRPVYTAIVSQYGRSSTATDYLSEPECKGYAPKETPHSGSTPAPISTTSPPASASTSSITTTSTPPQPQISMSEIERMINTGIMARINQLH